MDRSQFVANTIQVSKDRIQVPSDIKRLTDAAQIGRLPGRPVSIGNRLPMAARIQDIRPATRARYVIMLMRYFGELDPSVTKGFTGESTQRIVLFLIVCGSMGRVIMQPELERLLPDQCLRGLIHLERNMEKPTVNISLVGEAPKDTENAIILDRTLPIAAKLSAILLKTVLALGPPDAIIKRAGHSVARCGAKTLMTVLNTAVDRFVNDDGQKGSTDPRFQGRIEFWKSMERRSDLLLFSSYAHLTGHIVFGKNTGSMADDLVRVQLLSGIDSELRTIIKKVVHTGQVPSVYYCWGYLIPPYQV